MHFSLPLVALAALPTGYSLMLRDNVGRLPALGWNSWNAYHCDVDEAKIMSAAQQVVKLGLRDVGYEYINIDDCWSTKTGRNTATKQLIPDPQKFPTGIAGTADKIHALNLKIGIYSSAGTGTCAGYPASLGFEKVDAETWAAWGIDYLKYDNCGVPWDWNDQYSACMPEFSGGPFPNGTCPNISNPAPKGYDWATSNSTKRYSIMRDALLAQNRTIQYALCNWGLAGVDSWGNKTGSSWRSTGDIDQNWGRTVEILNLNSFALNSVDFWGHNDADMLEVGNGQLTDAESRSHFAFWAAMKSPLIIGTDLSILKTSLVDVLKNKYLLAFNQDDVFGKPAMPYKWGTNPDWTFNATNPAEYWSGRSKDGTLVLAFNSLGDSATREIKWNEVPELKGGDSWMVTDIWNGKSLGCVQGGIKDTVQSHDTVGYMIGEQCGTGFMRLGNRPTR
ncbi:probable Probable alpha-galactosidase B [Rhynchosporium secalis]|uniref:Alpha-galactosidase n=1 Tax=Rhynchosporium secalis TaxID=38038 RepID=A0A1E1M5D5_RHYSE|nr:probable Probable alpha-galactosidase B [Rhynchosporium secalis]